MSSIGCRQCSDQWAGLHFLFKDVVLAPPLLDPTTRISPDIWWPRQTLSQFIRAFPILLPNSIAQFNLFQPNHACRRVKVRSQGHGVPAPRSRGTEGVRVLAGRVADVRRNAKGQHCQAMHGGSVGLRHQFLRHGRGICEGRVRGGDGQCLQRAGVAARRVRAVDQGLLWHGTQGAQHEGAEQEAHC